MLQARYGVTQHAAAALNEAAAAPAAVVGALPPLAETRLLQPDGCEHANSLLSTFEQSCTMRTRADARTGADASMCGCEHVSLPMRRTRR